MKKLTRILKLRSLLAGGAPSNLNRRFYSSSSLALLHPKYISGFADAEGCFHVAVCKALKYKTG